MTKALPVAGAPGTTGLGPSGPGVPSDRPAVELPVTRPAGSPAEPVPSENVLATAESPAYPACPAVPWLTAVVAGASGASGASGIAVAAGLAALIRRGLPGD